MRLTHGKNIRFTYWKRRSWIGIPWFIFVSAFVSLRGTRIAHIHWLAWDCHLKLPKLLLINEYLTRLCIWWLKLLRFRIVWTVHNTVPHDRQTRNDIKQAQRLSSSAHRLIVHSAAVLQEIEHLGFEVRRAVVIPQGAYIGQYGPSPSVEVARSALGISPETKVILFFGFIRAYKGLPDLLEVWKAIRARGTLVIAGPCSDDSIMKQIDEYARTTTSILNHVGYVKDEDVPTYFSASDVVCMPFRSVTTSSTALMAMSMGKPIIAPRPGRFAIYLTTSDTSMEGIRSPIWRML